ncbi:MAG: DUF364 domain-containing protein [Syntrophorhabdaceae bacterium]|nr:DUF364 domain-containing protein [Syntrophorhabdaceae bacterium]MDD4195697.1 DUF364 domain-containing protein [Syntrophorhabdaceae bacterium]
MNILQDIISSITIDAPVNEVTRGIYWTAVVSRQCGLASTMIYDYELTGEKSRQEWHLQMSAVQLARGALSDDRFYASLGLAAINSLVEVDMERCLDVNAADYIARKGKGKNIAIIGHFPFVDDLRKIAGNVWVIEKRIQPGDHPEEEAAALLGQSDIVAISSTTLINHTLDNVLALCPAKSMRILLGPTTPLTSVLFDHGIDVISGSIVTDPDIALLHIRQGANFRELKRTGSVRLVTCIAEHGGNAFHA